MAYLLFHEIPDWTFYVASALLATAVWLVVRSYKFQEE
jgi:drug/metabolite transporter (DMT)-like permease